VDIYQVPETLPQEVLTKMHAPPKTSHPVLTDPDILTQYDGFIFAFPTRYGRAPAQISAFFDSTGGLWMKGALVGKFATVATSTAGQHGGQESTGFTTLPFFVHHGINYVPLGYSHPDLQVLTEVSGGTPWGASTIASGDGSRQPSEIELRIAEHHGKHFTTIVNQFVVGKERLAATSSPATKEVVTGGIGNGNGKAAPAPPMKDEAPSKLKDKKKKRFSLSRIFRSGKDL